MTLMAYRLRWFIRYYLFRRQLVRSGNKEIREMECGDFEYDAFVSYSNEDQAFVVELVDNLENQSPHYKLCVYERDFTAGTIINDCITQSIANSRKVISTYFKKKKKTCPSDIGKPLKIPQKSLKTCL